MPRKNIGLTAEGEKRKPKKDLRVNGSLKIEAAISKEGKKVTLRIDKNTSILVSPENCNEAYAQDYRERHGMVDKINMDRSRQTGFSSSHQNAGVVYHRKKA